MAAKKTKKDTLRAELTRYAKANGYAAHHVADAKCTCGSITFRLLLDDTAGAAVRVCESCKTKHPMGDSADFLDDADLDECQCPCGKEVFAISVAVSLYRGSDAVRWIYVGCRCAACGQEAVYGDWKNEHDDWRVLLANV